MTNDRMVPDGTSNEEVRKLLIELGWAENAAREMSKVWWSKRAIEEMKIGVIRKRRRAADERRRAEADELMKPSRRRKANGKDDNVK